MGFYMTSAFIMACPSWADREVIVLVLNIIFEASIGWSN